MKKIILLSIVFFFCLQSGTIFLQAQTLYGTTFNGGIAGYGTITKYLPGTNTSSVVRQFATEGSNPLFTNLIQANDGMLYGMTANGGSSGGGVIFSFNPLSSVYARLKDFDSSYGSRPYGSLVQASDGKFYGMTTKGGSDDVGVLFSFNPVSSTYRKLKDFDSIDGSPPYGSLVQATNGKLYGVTYDGGSAGGGVIFSFDPFSSVYTKLKDLNSREGSKPYGSLIQASDAKLYGMTSEGGKDNGGTIFSYDPLSSTYTKVKDFSLTEVEENYFMYVDGSHPHGSLCQGSNGKLYGTTFDGGVEYYGVIFSYDPISFAYTKLKDFDVSTGYPAGNLIQAANGRLTAWHHIDNTTM